MSRQAVAPENVPGQDGFFPAPPDSQWYNNLKRSGSCIQLLGLLKEDPTLIHALGDEDMTVLHKGVRHGCVALVKFILVDVFDARGLCKCCRHGADGPALTREQLLRKTCSYGSTAVNMAVVSGSPKMVVLLEWAIKMCRRLSGHTSQEMSLDKDDDINKYRRTVDAIQSKFMKKKRSEEEIHKESPNITDDDLLVPKAKHDDLSMLYPSRSEVAAQMESPHITDNDLSVPEVKDDDLSILYSSSPEVMSKVISVIEGVLGNPGNENREWMDMVKECFVEDVEFEFVPLAHVFLHFLFSFSSPIFSILRSGFEFFREAVTKRIFEACGGDGEDGESEAMLTTLFNILDPQGRTFLHCAYESRILRKLDEHTGSLEQLGNASASIKVQCWNARDGAGRSIFHLMAIHDDGVHFEQLQSRGGNSALIERLSSPQDQELKVLKQWCFPLGWDPNEYKLTPLEIVVLVDGRNVLGSSWLTDGHIRPTTYTGEWSWSYTLLQIAALLGRAKLIEDILKNLDTKFKSLRDVGLGNDLVSSLPAIHYAAFCGQIEAIQSILKCHTYDPLVQHKCGTALHLLLDKQQIKMDLNGHHNALLCHVLPNSEIYKHVKNNFLKLSCKAEDGAPRMYTPNETTCINLLLQAGIDVWTKNKYTTALPRPGPMANDDARKWWYEKVLSEVVVLKTSVSYAANATSVVAALVATASFIGPLQPPLGYGDVDGFIRTDRSSLRVYLVCNSFSFYFSIASILMALLPAIPMPKESLFDELLRSQRCLKGAAMMLLVSITCLLISFSSASMAVVSPDWHERGIVVGCVIFGGVLCIVVLVIYIIRLLRMTFHKNDRFRRMFAKYMYF